MGIEQLTDAVQLEQFGLKVCRSHSPLASPIVYDEAECPLCRIMHELKLSEKRRLSIAEQKEKLREKGFL
jgi:hypothetical protein